ncbi:MAG TPA: hypothetical protein VK442_00350 [Xanthobacteraceae bacterium]|nr:hypothetical protein [Xanthobacteraceae bacterium]
MPDEPRKSVVEIASEPATGAEPPHVSVYIDGDRRYTIRTSDLENIGTQLRGKTKFSFFNTALPIIITLITVVGTTVIGQLFQYISWRNSTSLQTATARAERALATFQKASLAVSKRYYATFLFLGAARDLANRKKDLDSKLYKLHVELSQQRFNAFYVQIKSWNEDYDQLLSAIDYSLDGPVLGKHLQVSFADFENKDNKIDCRQILVSELRRLNLTVDSLKVQFAAINYCFANSIKAFNAAKDQAIVDNSDVISNEVKDDASALNEAVRQMSDEFRCFAQHRIGFLEQQKQGSIFRPSTWIYDRSIGAFLTQPDSAAAHLQQTLGECDYSQKPIHRPTAAESVSEAH